MQKRFFRLCNIILVLTLLLNMLPMTILAENFKDSLAAKSHDTIKDTTTSETYLVNEVESKRTEYSKTFLLSNGTQLATVYADAVHYETENGWKEIDNTLKLNTDGTLSNTAGVWDVQFPGQLSKSNAVCIEKDSHVLSFALAGELRSSGELMTAAMNNSASETLATAETQLSVAKIQPLDLSSMLKSVAYEEMIPEKLNSRLKYENVFQNTHVVYDLESNKVKESIIIDTYSNTLRGYRYTLHVGDMIPVLEESGRILFYDKTQETVVMAMPAPYMVDANNNYNSDVQVQLTGSNGTYTLTYLLPRQWLASDDRAWPVVLDPVVQADVAATSIEDQTVAERKTLDYTWGMMEAGYSDTWGIARFFIKYKSLPEITSSDVVISATIQLCKGVDSVYTAPVEAHKVNGSWSSQSITWYNKPGYDNNIEDFAIVKNAGYYGWVITDIVRDWYSKENTGIMFKVSDEVEDAEENNYKQFCSSDLGYNKPILAIEFRNNNGLESYWDYTSSSAGRAGTGNINNFTGNLVWTRDDIGFDGNLMPVNISHIYNLNDAIIPNDNNNSNDSGGNGFGLGTGWRTNFNQLVYRWNIDDDLYVWEDSDGTDHYFKPASGEYKDEDGLELTLTDTGSGTEKYCITDKNGNCSYFDTQGRLTKLSNNQQTKSHITITYRDSTDRRISTVTDGAGRVYQFTYNSNNLLTKIGYTGSGTEELSYVTFDYNGSNLWHVTDKDGGQSTYTYNNAGLLHTASDIDGYKLTYTYTTRHESWQPYRVTGVGETDGTAQGGTLTFTYAHNQTTITDHNGNVNIMQFNDLGNLTCIQDNEGRAQYAQYAKNVDDDTGKANQLKVSSKLQNSVANVVYHGSFENDVNWSNLDSNITNYTSTSAGIYYAGSYALYIHRSNGDGESAVYGESFYAPPGRTFTFSAYVLGADVASYLALSDGSTTVTSEVRKPQNAWTRVEVTYTNNTSSIKSVTPYIYSLDAGYIFVDCVQIEQENTASRYNLVENGDFRHNSYTWSSTSGFALKAVSSAAPGMQTAVYSVTGDPQNTNRATQNVKVNGNAGDSYVYCGWAKGDSAPLTGDRTFGLQAYFNYNDGTTSKVYEVSFNPDTGTSDNWQYVAIPIIAEKAYSSVTVQLVYDYNVNMVYFDGIQLFKEEFGTSYTYDDDGNVISVKDLQGQLTSYEYDTDSNLTKIIQNNKAKMTYTYDDWHNIKTATSSEGLSYAFTYDTFGNNTEVSISDGAKTISSSAEYSDDGNQLESTTDALGKTTTYSYYADTNLLEWVQHPEDTEDTRTEYSYDNMYRLASAACETDTGLSLSAEYTYTDDLLTSIVTPSTTYDFDYGVFDLRTEVSIGNRTLASYSYTDDGNYYLSALDYGNDDSVNYTYDSKGRLLTQTYEDGDTVTYTYDNSGMLARETDSGSGITTTYHYDLTDRLIKYAESGTGYSHSVGYEYDKLNNLTELVENINGTERTTTYTYDDDNRVTSSTTGNTTVTYEYDDFGRVTTQTTKNGSTVILTESYTYKAPTSTTTSAQIATYTTAVPNGYSVTYSYTYDDNGNILTVSDGSNTTSYEYDSANQLIRENNQAGNFTHTWTYDNAGNILTRKEYAYTTGELGDPTDTVSYIYGDDDGDANGDDEGNKWGDLLTAYNGNAITYDQIGNPLTDGTWNYTWEHGRQLASMSYGQTTWTYTYNADGLRTERTSGDTTYKYYYNGSQLSRMTVGSTTLDFTYDASGTPLTITRNGEVYYYVTNLQGDVTAILDEDGIIVATYVYDAWGNPLAITGSMATTLGQINPLRYRGYVYDVDTGLYYLQSRYYNPQTGRFLNADGFATTGQGFIGNNMFAYCGNNPVIFRDAAGTRHEISAGGGSNSGNYQYIYSQNDFSISGKLLGLSTIEHSGCGVLATYNALITLGNPKSFDSVLNYYNKRPTMHPLGGAIGMSPFAVASYFSDNGYRVILTSDSDAVDVLSTTADASIFYYLYEQTYKPLGVKVEAFGHHFIEYHKLNSTLYEGLNAATMTGYRTFRYPSDLATNFVAILIYE